MTRGVWEQARLDPAFASFCAESLSRHKDGDWGDLGPEDKAANDQALVCGERLFSAYTREELPKIWIITEADRSATTTLFPEEY
jgi:hypothetical protein